MRNRYQRPAPSLELIELYLRYEQPTQGERLAEPDAAEARRVEGVEGIRALARAALAEAGDPNRLGAIPFELRQRLAIAGLRILLSDDPERELESYLGKKPQERGRPAMDLDYRDFMIAVDVAELHANGKTLGAAYEEVDKRMGTPGIRRIENIYHALREDPWVRAELEWRQSQKRIEAIYLAPPEDPADRAALERLFAEAPSASDPRPEIEGQKITRKQWEEYSALAAAEYPNGLTFEDHQELWSFVRRTSFPH
jgi:hypothetical protein